MTHDLRHSEQVTKGFDTDQGFMLVEISGDLLYFQTISRGWQTIDSGAVARQNSKAATTAAAQ